MTPTIGRVVHYTLTDADAQQINRRRSDYQRARGLGEWPANGAQAHVGNSVAAGDAFPAIIVRVWGNDEAALVNLHVVLDGSDTYWAASRKQGNDRGEWRFPGLVANAPAG